MKSFSPSAEKNQAPIARVLAGVLPSSGRVLEVASGSGQHVIHFAREFPHLVWQPSDADPLAIASIEAWRREAALPNILPAIALDASSSDWPIGAAEAVLSINMTHISPWAATVGLVAGAARVLATGAPLVLYGPYVVEGRETAPSNVAFDASLRAKDPSWGVRSLGEVVAAARPVGLELERFFDMPGNNITIVLRRR
jgi:hypothetical protein